MQGIRYSLNPLYLSILQPKVLGINLKVPNYPWPNAPRHREPPLFPWFRGNFALPHFVYSFLFWFTPVLSTLPLLDPLDDSRCIRTCSRGSRTLCLRNLPNYVRANGATSEKDQLHRFVGNPPSNRYLHPSQKILLYGLYYHFWTKPGPH
jgi:hypothetical protein